MDAGDPIVHSNDGEIIQAKFVAAGTPGEAKLDPLVGVARDIAWIEPLEGDDEGLLVQAFYRQLRPRED
jgi:hypothetical protein